MSRRNPPKWLLDMATGKVPCYGCRNPKCFCNTFPHWCAACGNVTRPWVEFDPWVKPPWEHKAYQIKGVVRTCAYIKTCPRTRGSVWDERIRGFRRVWSAGYTKRCASEDIFTPHEFIAGAEDREIERRYRAHCDAMDNSYPMDPF